MSHFRSVKVSQMSVARKHELLDDAHWMGLVAASRAIGETRLRVLTLVVKGELEAKHVAGRTIISRASVERFLAARQAV